MASAAPPVRYPNVYGIDMPVAYEFIADGASEEDIARYIGVDWLIYQDLDDLIECTSGVNDRIDGFDTSIFDGNYVTGGVDKAYLSRVETLRSDKAKERRIETDFDVIELHNQA